MTENKQSSADHTLHLSPAHCEWGRRRGCKFLNRGSGKLVFLLRGRGGHMDSNTSTHTTTLNIAQSPVPPHLMRLGRSQDLRSGGISAGWEARGGHGNAQSGSHRQRHPNAPVRPLLSSRALASGGATTQLDLPPRPQGPGPSAHVAGGALKGIPGQTQIPPSGL